jgi:hypothetical protein
MSVRTTIAPETLSISLLDYGIQVTYLDDKTTVYRGVPEAVESALTTSPGKATHVLVCDPTETKGVMMYINDRTTHDDVLRATGVGRVVLAPEETNQIFPGVTATRLEGQRTRIEADIETARGRVFVFAEDDWTEESYEFVDTD